MEVDMKCINGHDMVLGQQYCSECGAQAEARTIEERVAALEHEMEELRKLLSQAAKAEQTPSKEDDRSAWLRILDWVNTPVGQKKV